MPQKGKEKAGHSVQRRQGALMEVRLTQQVREAVPLPWRAADPRLDERTLETCWQVGRNQRSASASQMFGAMFLKGGPA